MFCNNCGAPLQPGQAYCTSCGAPARQTQVQQTQMLYNSQSPAQAPTGRMPVTPVQAQPYTQQYAQPTQRSNPLTPILAALCGMLGMVFVTLCLIMGGVIHIGDNTTKSDTTTVQSDTSASGTTETTKETETTKDDSSKDTTSTNQDDEETKQTPATDTSNQNSSNQVTPAPSEPQQQQSSTETPTSSAPTNTSEYVLPDSNSRYYSQSELSGYSNWELYIARNEIYARHGRKFRKEDLREHFKSCSWYQELYDPGYFEEHIEQNFNDYERKNADTIKAVEGSRGSPYLA